MTIDKFRKAMAYTRMKATEAEIKEAKRMARAIIERNRTLFNELAKL